MQIIWKSQEIETFPKSGQWRETTFGLVNMDPLDVSPPQIVIHRLGQPRHWGSAGMPSPPPPSQSLPCCWQVFLNSLCLSRLHQCHFQHPGLQSGQSCWSSMLAPCILCSAAGRLFRVIGQGTRSLHMASLASFGTETQLSTPATPAFLTLFLGHSPECPLHLMTFAPASGMSLRVTTSCNSCCSLE